MPPTRSLPRRTPLPAVVTALLAAWSGPAAAQPMPPVDTSVPAGSNHAAAQPVANGRGTPIAILDLISFRNNELGGVLNGRTGGIMPTIPGAKPGDPPVIANLLGPRLRGQFNFSATTPTGGLDDPARRPAPLTPDASNWDPHATLTAHVAAGKESLGNNGNHFLGVANGSDVYFGGSTTFSLPRYQNATDFLNRTHGVRIFNLSLGLGGGDPREPLAGGENGTSGFSLYSDWFMTRRDALIIKSAGNNGVVAPADPDRDDGQRRDGSNFITIPGDFYNGITVGSSDRFFQRRADYSSYWLAKDDGTPLDDGTKPDVRGKPDILAPGTDIDDNKSYAHPPSSGTSFAAPLVTGTAAMVSQQIDAQGGGEQHLAIKAIILNSARKISIVGQNAANNLSLDGNGTGGQASDDLYLKSGPDGIVNELRVGATGAADAEKSPFWTPSEWSYDGDLFKATRPLDDEQGVGVLDARRAVLLAAAGEHGPGPVPNLGWDRGELSFDDPLDPFARYELDLPLRKGDFLTATLVWDRQVREINDPNDPAALLGQVDAGDRYVLGELADLALNLYFRGTLVATSDSSVDNVEHLHIPLARDGNARDYVLEARLNFGGSTRYAIAWQTVPEPPALALVALGGAALALLSRRRRTARPLPGAGDVR